MRRPNGNAMAELQHLFSLIKIRSLEIKNRLFMPPMATGYATIRGDVTDRLIAHYVERAKGGSGLITVEFTYVSPSGKLFEHMLGLYDDSMIDGFSRLTKAVHQNGAKVAIQLSHAGRRTHSNVTGTIPVAPSPVPRLNGEVPRELTLHEIEKLIDDFVSAALRAKRAGFDAVMVHMAHGYLIHQFLSPLSNRRQDCYGGSTEGRARFAIEIVQRMREQLGQDFPMTCRYCADEFMEMGFDLTQSRQVAKWIVQNGIDAIDVSAGTHETDYIMSAPSSIPRGFLVHLSTALKQEVQVPVGIVGRITEPVLAEEILAEGKADFVSMGRALIADPELPLKAFTGQFSEIRPCTACNQGCNDRMYQHLDISCQTNPMTGRELDFRIEPTKTKKRVLIVGAGPAGLEAARVSALRGHEVHLYERAQALGGQLKLASKPPGKSEYDKLAKYYEYQMEKLKVNVVFRECKKERIEDVDPDVVIFATGGRPKRPAGLRIDNETVMDAWAVLRGVEIPGKDIVIIGGGQVGCETADYLLERDKRITILEKLGELAPDMSPRARKLLIRKLISSGVEIIKQAVVIQILKGEIRFETGGLKQKIRNFDHIVLAMGTEPETEMFHDLGEIRAAVFKIGDCAGPRRVNEAIREGFELALEL
jgi:2,4-dienoyl-CoA reductase-like NADH-dependent reductase (Old Yellow Enzyme family)/thioredoxin reductase